MVAGAAISLSSTLATADPAQLGAGSTSQDFVHALTPAPGAPAMKFRGLRVLNSNPAAGEKTSEKAAAPAVAVDIKFALNSADLSSQATALVEQIATAMKSDQLATYHFMLEGHTDTTGSRPYNVALSKRRAESVREYLIKTDHIAPDRLGAAGRGPDDLLDPAHPDSPDNRRVEIVNLGK
jgi:outer membrane protein OmpA-like peptidoglycan-associated protein